MTSPDPEHHAREGMGSMEGLAQRVGATAEGVSDSFFLRWRNWRGTWWRTLLVVAAYTALVAGITAAVVAG